MKAFTQLNALAVPLDAVNVDTDQIIPKQFLKKIDRSGFGQHLFHYWRYLDDAGTQPDPEFILNHPRYQGAQILLGRDNFGCGSSREHAPWALLDYGFRCVIAPSFADIFFSNCRKNGILAVVLDEGSVQELFEEVAENEGCRFTVDLVEQRVSSPGGRDFTFAVDSFGKHCLLNGLDDIGWTLQFETHISNFESSARRTNPWLYLSA